MITKIEAFSQQPDAPELPLGGFMPSDDPVYIRGLEGVGPVKATITTTPLSERGELYQGSSTPKRNIVLTLGLSPDWAGNQTMAQLRHILYRYFMPEQWTKLRFYSDELARVDIEGWVESFEPNTFSEDPEIQISIICPNPDFVEPDATILKGVVDDGTIETVFEYLGTLNTGFELRVERSIENPSYTGGLDITLTAERKDQLFRITPVTIDTTKYFKLTTVRGLKRVQSIAEVDGAASNLLGNLDAISVWPVIKPGENVFKIDAAENGQTWTLAYFTKLGGL